MGGGWCYDYGGVDLRKESAWIRTPVVVRKSHGIDPPFVDVTHKKLDRHGF
jgi:hypothetical protein